MVHKISLFNHNNSYGTTITTFNLGWMLASKGKRVILVDTDPQCNLTWMALKEEIGEDETRIENIYKRNSNIMTALAPAFQSQTRLMKAVDCIPIQSQEGLFLLPGHVGFAEYEVTLGLAQELSGSLHSLKDIPGAISDLLRKTAKAFNAEYILIGMSSNLGAINQNLLMTSDFFLMPTTADFLSVMAIDSFARVLPKWCNWAKNASSYSILREAVYPFPEFNLRFLGTIIHNYGMSLRGQESLSFQNWVSKLERAILDKLMPVLTQNNMILPNDIYNSLEINSSFTLAKISNFLSLMAISEEQNTPVNVLKPEQLGSGIVGEHNQRKQEEFKQTFSNLADKIIALTSTYAIST